MESSLTPREQKRLESDTKILNAAAKIFGARGYANATLTEIAAEAGVSQGLVSQRFGSKENLLNRVFEQTRILSFFSEEDRHLPQAMYVFLDHLKREVRSNPAWFSFLAMIHTGVDTPPSLEEKTRSVFLRTPLFPAIVEAQQQGYLPKGEPWDIFRVFFRNATNLIGWYHRFSLPMPDNDTFLYAIQYSRREKETQARLKSQTEAIHSLQSDQDMLFAAVSSLYPLIIFSNLTANEYHMLEYDCFTTKRAKNTGTYDDLIQVGASTIPNDIQKNQFLELFLREHVIEAAAAGKRELLLRHQQTGDDGIDRWIETRVLLRPSGSGELLTITLSKPIDDEMARIRSYEEALIRAEFDLTAKTRFLSSLSHEIRTPMQVILGYSELAKHNADDPEKVRDCMEKMRLPGERLTAMLDKALALVNRPEGNHICEVRVNINDCVSLLMDYARQLAERKGVALRYEAKNLRDCDIYADEIHLNQITMALICNAIDSSAPGGSIRVCFEQLQSDRPGTAPYRFTVTDNGIGMSRDALEHIFEPAHTPAPDGVQEAANNLSMPMIKRYLNRMGGSIKIQSELHKGTTVTCVLPCRQVL